MDPKIIAVIVLMMCCCLSSSSVGAFFLIPTGPSGSGGGADYSGGGGEADDSFFTKDPLVSSIWLNETFYIKDVEGRYVGNYSARNIMGHGHSYPKASYTLDGSLDKTIIQSAGKYCIGFDNRINCSGGSGDDRGNFKLEKQSDGGYKVYNEGLGAYLGLTKDVLYKEIDKAKYPDDKQNMILYLESVP